MITQISTPIGSLFGQLQEMLVKLTDEQYGEPITLLSGASIGQHTRHIIELFLELEKGYASGFVNYDGRKRDPELELLRDKAIRKMAGIAARLDRENKALTLVIDLDSNMDNPCRIPTNYQRELVYNLEHSIHHMALLRIGVNAVSTIVLPHSFGVATSTLKNRKPCAQ